MPISHLLHSYQPIKNLQKIFQEVIMAPLITLVLKLAFVVSTLLQLFLWHLKKIEAPKTTK